MAMTQLAVQQMDLVTGLEPAFTAANADGHAIENYGDMVLIVKTVGTGTTVTIETPSKKHGVDLEEIPIIMSTSEEWTLGPFPTSENQSAGGLVGIYVTFSAVTAVTVAAIRL